MSQIPLVMSLLAGLVTFVSPCVLPLIPAYLTFITGLSANEMASSEVVEAQKKWNWRPFIQTLLFVIGFSLIFVLMGASATFLGGLIQKYSHILRLVGGAVVILFGLHVMGVFNIKFFQYERRIHLAKKPSHFLGAAVVGATFALGWSPCIGPILGSILTYASTQDTVTQGVILLAVYSLGLGIPFLAVSLAIGFFLRLFSKIKHYYRAIALVSGGLLVIVGLLILTGHFESFTSAFITS